MILEMYAPRLSCYHLIVADNPWDALRLPEQLVDVVVDNDMIVIALATDELSFDDLYP